MAELVNITFQSTKNLLSSDSLLNNNPTINYNSGSVSGTGTISDELVCQNGASSFKVNEFQNVIKGLFCQFDFGTALEYTATRNGIYTFSFYALKGVINANPNYNVDFKLKIFVNSVLVETFVKSELLEVGSLEDLRFAQSFQLFDGDVVNFAFELESPSVGTPNPNITLYFTGFQLNYGNYNDYYKPIENNVDYLLRTLNDANSTQIDEIKTILGIV